MKDKNLRLHMVSYLPDTEPVIRDMEAVYRIMRRETSDDAGIDRTIRSKSFYAARLMYEQKLEEHGDQRVPEILTARLDPEGSVCQITMKRPSGSFRLEFEEGKIFVTEYPTPAGVFDLAIRTKELTGRFDEDRLWARIRYETWLEEEPAGETRLEIWGKLC